MEAGSQKYAICSIADKFVGIHLDNVLRFEINSEITQIPHLPQDSLGVISYKNNSVFVKSLRTLLGYNSFSDVKNEIIEKMDDARLAHITWKNECKHSIDTKSPFILESDPKRCAFGKWYYSFKEEKSNHFIKQYLDRIEQPHKEVYDSLYNIKKAMSEGNKQLALLLYEKNVERNVELILDSFNHLREYVLYNIHEVRLIAQINNHCVALTVDEVSDISTLVDGLKHEKTPNSKISHVLLDEKSGVAVNILNLGKLL